MVSTEKSVNTLKIGIYAVYDSVLKQYEPPVSCPENKLQDYFSLIINDLSSKYYRHEADYILFKIGEFDNEYCTIKPDLIRLQSLDTFIDEKKRRLQVMVQTLNYLPVGYFKMSDEQKKVIQEKIDLAIADYVNEIAPDLDFSNLKNDNSSTPSCNNEK